MQTPTIQIAKNLTGNYFQIDVNNDGEIEISEAIQVSYLNLECQSCNITSKINSLEGIQFFTNIQKLFCRANNISIINLTTLNQLNELGIEINQISTLNLNNLTQLFHLNCSANQIQNLDVSALTNLSRLDCSFNQLTSLDLSNNIGIDNVYCNNNQLTNINLQNLTDIGVLSVQFNQLTQLNLNNITTINGLLCYNNLLTTLNLNNQYNLSSLQCQNNQLISLYLKNNKFEGNIVYPLNFSNNPNLQFICCDEIEENSYKSMVASYGYTNCSVSSYCTFSPGGIIHTTHGRQKYDDENNGCDVNDNLISNFKYSITNGTALGTIISNSNGTYSIPVNSGFYTLSPVLENPTYFTVSPTSVTVNFPTQASPFMQDFCVIANGIHSDVEVIILPTVSARPGFDAKYKIIYRNKGNQVENGAIAFTYNDAVLDYISANPVYDSQATDTFTWNYTNLEPFETREIEVVFNVNSPTETPAVNINDVLNYTAVISTSNTDETPNNNEFTLNQSVVGSYDPNDKTCLEGETVGPDMIGEYVHYLIRFENTGTYPAENVVVKDMIDVSKFDLATLIPLKGSHEFYTRIKDNKVEFIFENINLDFNDATNDGYVAFKIKTKSTLVLGDTFSNDANIYFDYNFPITTNTYTTTIQALSIQDFDFNSKFTLYPNPVQDVLHFNSKENLEIQSVEIYNMLGQIVISVPNSTTSVDVSSLKSGNYFIKVNTEQGISNTKFIKE